MRPASIRSVLVGGALALLGAVMGAAAVIAYDAGEDEAAELFDARLATSARVLAALLGTMAPPPGGEATRVVSLPRPLEQAVHDAPLPMGHHYETKIAFQVLDASGAMLMRSSSAPQAPMAPAADGFVTTVAAGHTWRVFTLRADSHWIQVAERDDVRAEIAWKLATATIAPLVVGTLLMGILLVLLVRHGLAPLEDLARGIERRQPGSLAPVALRRTPAEVAPVVRAINGLLGRVGDALARERRFTADAAHELRTPLAALKVHAQNASRAERPADRRTSLDRMLAGLDRSIRLVEQMLAYSRATAGREPAGMEAVSLQQVVEDALDDVATRPRARAVRFGMSFQPGEDIMVAGDRAMLVAMVRNLLDNAARFSLEGGEGRVRVDVRREAGTVTLEVVDDGPGVPPELRERVFESYFRIPGSAGDGSGLGLAIVREIAAQHGARVRLEEGDGGRGTRVVVSFPAPAPEAPASRGIAT